MSGRERGSNRAMHTPIHTIFTCLQQRLTVSVWLYEQTQSRIEGKIRGFDEFMNIVLDDAIEVSTKDGSKEDLGRIMLKGDNITLISSLEL
ncbi:hypothetical protein PSN45_004725 [Yamadazyma tenuis]|uniref:Small nuclear ribonucleoprotein E n=1 Tax=Candida tenuis (strain ATCC 10573 / BCRC 21748 / CBS 615 / JCM 9827 / NBRC 10315 / NRRL Y-1498 / VKM Y-70) TaxID=590646 RepID=G3B6S2_CANTC|nr:LSM-domain-containing protein [Yamadazyma tenuis ATCC 10573]EGV63005.1 LSM-domain-containing protein [Yamadazyma tenuis ATCC 10573]WEJ97177.1 hypothetical protein PSN45_004725 [Yamadazyma tenuis]